MEEVNIRLPPLGKSFLASANIIQSFVRKGGNRLDQEMIGSKLVVHNYGFGPDEPTLGFASTDLAVKMLNMKIDLREVFECAVLGAGVAGYYTALLVARSGKKVTLYSDRTYELKKVPQPSLVPRTFMPAHYDWPADPLRHELLSKIACDYLRDSARVSRYQGVRIIKAYDLARSQEELKEVVSDYILDTFQERSIRLQGRLCPKAVAYSTLLVDSPLLVEELRVEAQLRGVKLVEKAITSKKELLDIKENYVYNCMGEHSANVFGEAELEAVSKVVLQFNVQSPQEKEFVLTFGEAGSYEIYSLRKKSYLVGPAAGSLEESTEAALRAVSDLAKQFSLLPSL